MSDSLSSLYGGRGIALTHGVGSHVFDSADRGYIDFFNGHGASLFGHSHPLLTEALERAAKGVWTSGAGFESPIREKLADELGLMLGEGRVFLCNSGTEAIEAALKLVLTLRKGRSRILACRRGFHGRSCGALSITFNPKYREPFMPLVGKAEHFSMEDLAENIDDNTAAVFIEPVQGEEVSLPFLWKQEIKLPKHAENTLPYSYPMRYRAALKMRRSSCKQHNRAGSRHGMPGKRSCGRIPAGALVWKKSSRLSPAQPWLHIRRKRADRDRFAGCPFNGHAQ